MVAQKLLDLCQHGPTHAVEEIGGPDRLFYKTAIKNYQQYCGSHSLILGIPNKLLGKVGQALTTPQRTMG